jgi:hypothetical protein
VRNPQNIGSAEQSMFRILLLLLLVPFAVLTALALWHQGVWGMIAPHFRTWGAAQVLADLVLALSLVLFWLWRDAKQCGRNPWPWLVATLLSGSFGPLLYLLTRPSAPKAAPAAPAGKENG